MIRLIAGVADNHAIGTDNKIPWHYPQDLQYFKQKTLDSCIIVGRHTWESFGSKPLPRRRHIILSKSMEEDPDFDNVHVAESPSKAIRLAEMIENDIWICGGQKVYEALWPWAREVYITRIPESPANADAFFPYMDMSLWSEKEPESAGDLKVQVYERL